MIPIMSWCTSEIHHHIYLVHIIWLIGWLLFNVQRAMGSTYPEKEKPDTHHMMYHFCSMKLDFFVSRYLLGTLEGTFCAIYNINSCTSYNNWRQTTLYNNVHVSQMRIQTFPEYLFLKRKFQIPLRIKWSSPKIHICGSREGEVPFVLLGYRQNILARSWAKIK
jgi:hypothetical protein